jgi:hypothetical protein
MSKPQTRGVATTECERGSMSRTTEKIWVEKEGFPLPLCLGDLASFPISSQGYGFLGILQGLFLAQTRTFI